MANHRRVGRSSSSELPANEEAERSVAPATVLPSATTQASGPISRLKDAFASFRKVERARSTDVSSALFRRSRSGRIFSPWHFTHHGREPHDADGLPPLPTPSRTKRTETAGTLAHSAIVRVRSDVSADAIETAVATQHDAAPRADLLRTAQDVRLCVASELISSPFYPAESDEFASRLYDIASRDGASRVAAARARLFVDAARKAGIRETWFAHRMLQHIASLDFDTPYRTRAANDEDRYAWHVVRELSRSDLGFSMLEQIRVASGVPFRDRTHRIAIKILLESAAALDYAPHDRRGVSRTDYAPGAVAARMGHTAHALGIDEPGETALAKRAFDAARTLLAAGPDSLTPDQCGALLAWRQGFHEDRTHSELSQTQERLHKFVTKSIPRVEEDRWKTLLPRMLLGKRASPLSALRFGTRGVPRETIAREQEALKRKMSETRVQIGGSAAVAPIAVLTHARASRKAGARAARELYVEHRDTSIREKTRAALSRLLTKAELRPSVLLTHARAQSSVVELAALQVWLDRGGFPGGHPDHAALVDIARHACNIAESLASSRTVRMKQGHVRRRADRLVESAAAWQQMSAAQLAKAKPFSRLVKEPFDVMRLAAWGKVTGVPEDDPFWLEVRDLLELEDSSPAAGARDIATVHETLTNVIMRLQSGQRLRLSDGGHQGISTRGLNVSTKAVLDGLAIPVSPRLDMRASRTREAVVEISRSTQGVEFFIGTADGIERHLGAGLMVGYDIDIAITSLRAGLVTNFILHAHETSRPRGVSIRVARRIKPDGSGYDDQAMRAKLAEINDFLFNEAALAPGGGPNGLWNRLAERYWNDPDVSTSWTDSLVDTTRRGVTVDATATAEFYKFGVDGPKDPGDITLRAGPSAGVGWQRSRQTVDSVEHSGSLRVEQHRINTDSYWQLRKGIAPGFAHPLSSTGHESIGLLSIDTPVKTTKVGQRNTSAKLHMVREEGRLVHRACLLDVEYSDADGYVAALHASRHDIFQLLLAHERSKGPANPDPATLRAQAARANQRIDAFIADVHVNRSPHLNYVLRHRLRKDAAEALDANTALIEQAGGDALRIARLEADNERILRDPTSWMLVELKVRERTTRAQSIGPSAIAHFNTRTSATGDREIIVENVSFEVLESLDTA